MNGTLAWIPPTGTSEGSQMTDSNKVGTDTCMSHVVGKPKLHRAKTIWNLFYNCQFVVHMRVLSVAQCVVLSDRMINVQCVGRMWKDVTMD